MECLVCEQVDGEPPRSPVMIESAELGEVVYRRGEEALRIAPEAMQLVSHALPAGTADVIVAAWPFELRRLERLYESARGRRWGIAVPVIFPVTTDLQALEKLAGMAQRFGARFLAAVPVDLDAPARKAIAQSMTLDSETYEMLFHADLEPIAIATERHIAALAQEIGVADFVLPPRWEEKSNWNAGVLLTLAATRMLAMKHDVELASRLARSGRAVAQLDKPIERVAAAASLSIIEALDEISVDVLSDWLESGRSAFLDHIDKQWRLRRDAGLA